MERKSEIQDLGAAMSALEHIRENATLALEVHCLGEAALNLLIAENAG